PFDTAVSRLSLAETDADLDAADLIFDTGELLPDPPVKLKDGGAWLMTSPDVAVEDRAAEVNAEGRMLRLRKLMRNSQILELSAPPSLQPGMVETVYAALAQDHQHVVFTKDTPGGLVGSLFAALARTALVMLASGQRPSLVEEAARSLGFRQGPLQMIDVLGAGRSLALMRRVYEHRGASLAPLRLLSDRMADVTGGDASRARRALVFHAPAGQSFARDPDLQEWLTEWRSDHDHAPAAWPETDLKDALLAALVREAVNLHANGIVERLSDIDLATVHGLMMDRRRGGPLIAADVAGLLGIKRGLERLTTVDPALWSKSDQLDDMIKYGRRFF
ncbi:MAG: 3-hydroxyacyl-CoA dehydrogenase family protein, partial [Pseudomonadota bacterium]